MSLDKNHHVLVLFVDFSKAFDTLSHEKLLDVLYKIGIRGTLWKWMESYLKGRTFKVKILNSWSQERICTHGVPQGSKLGPVLFIIFTNALLKVFKNSTVFAYADDIAIVVRHRCLKTAISTMQQEFDEVSRWCHDFGLIVNATKTKLMHIRTPSQQKERICIFYQNPQCPTWQKSDPIEIVKSTKYLGVTIDDHFLWREHIYNLRLSMRSAMFAMFYLERYSTKDVQKQVYFSLVESRLRYGVLAWGNASKTHTDKLVNLQHRIVKIIDKNHLYFKFLSVDNIFKMTAILEYYDDPRFQQSISHNINTRRRAQGLFEIPAVFNNYGRRQLSYTLPSIMNQLPTNLKNIQNFKKRKKCIKLFFLN